MTKLAKTFSAPRYNTLIGIVLACVMGVLTYFGLFYQQKAIAQDYPIQGFDVSHHQE
ncbi:GH25 family lysozyme, partial [Acinetobacter baumannii]